MKGWIGTRRGILAVMLAPLLVWAAGCRSYHIDITVENRTGGAIQLLEVDYPSASFGADTLAAGAVFRYRIQVRGHGPLKVEYSGRDGRQAQIKGPELAEREQGQLRIVLLPESKAEFPLQLTGKP